MFILILYLLYTVSAQTSSTPIYSRTYLRSFKRLENERIQSALIIRGITYIENRVFAAAKQGLVQYTTDRFEGCEKVELYNRPSDLAPFGFDKDVCENVVNGIRTLVSERFPDSEVLYDTNTKRYTLKWD